MKHDDLTNQTREYYDALISDMGEGYLDFRWSGRPVRSSHYAHTKAVVEELLNDIGPVHSLLEVGPGPGTWTEVCVEHARELTLLDISEEMLKVAASRFSHHEDIRYLRGDFVEHDPQLEESFDLLFTARALEYMSDKVAAVERIWSYLRPGGATVVITKNPGWWDKRRDDRRPCSDPDTSGSADLQRDWIGWPRLMDILRNQGFQHVEARPVAFGSYEWPLPARVGTAFAGLIRSVWGRRPMHRALDWIVESYVVVGRKPDGTE